MKTNISKMWRSGLAMLMVLCMAVSLFPAAALAVEGDVLTYVSLGDSMTSGNGLDDVAKAYPATLAAAFGWQLNQRAVSDTSAAELSAMLAEGSDAAPLRAAVSGADVISFGMGHTDFSTILPERAVNAVNGEVYEFDVESAIEAYPSEVQTLIVAMQEQLGTTLDAKIRDKVSDGEKAAALCDTIVNSTMSFVVDYAEALEGIMALNPDAVVILVGVLNYFEGKDASAESEAIGVSLQEIMDEVIPYVNAYIAAIPAAMQLLGDEAFEQAVFFFAEAEDVELLSCGCPSEEGHVTLTAAIVDTLENGYTVNDELLDSKDEILHALVNSKSNEGTHGQICIDDDTYYVALGDSPAVSESYVDLLAGELGVSFNNLAQSGLFVQDAAAVVTENQAEIEKADLITVGFSNVPFLTEAMSKFTNGDSTKPDWSSLMEESEIETIQLYLSMMEGKLGEFGIKDEATKEKTMYALEAYLYNCVAYAIKMPELIDQIHEINPEVLVAIVGMYNPLDGVTLNMGEGMNFAMGELFDEMVDLMGLYDIMYAMGHANTFYVYAPEVSTKLTKTELNSLDIYRVFLAGKGKDLNPSEEGQAYVCQQIMNALTVTTPVLLGDVDHSGDVNFFDGMLVLQYYAGVIDETGLDVSVADVDAGGSIDFFDGMYMLQYYAGVIEKLPAEA